MTTYKPDVIALVHALDDSERLRTRYVRLVNEQTLMLMDALEALQAGDTHVTAEFLERSIAAMNAVDTTLHSGE